MSESTSTSYSGLQPYSSESAQTASTRHTNVTEPITSKRVCFYKSGDPQFNGIKMVVSNRSFKTFDALLDGLSKRVPLPFGVRNISTPRGVHQVSTLDELEDGKSYICSHQKKFKPINLERASKKPLLWQSSRPISARRRVAQLLRQNEVNPAPRDNTLVLGLSKKLVIFKNGDPGFKNTVTLNKKSTQNFEAILDHITEVMRCPVIKLYTADGRRIFGIQALLLSSGAIVAAGREPFKPANYDPATESLPVKLPGISRRVLPKAKNKPEGQTLLKASQQTNSTPRSSIHSLSSYKTLNTDKKPVDVPYAPENNVNMADILAGEDLPLMHSEDDIEKSVHVNPDGTMTVEMKIRLRIKSDETIQWTTTVSRANITSKSDPLICSTVDHGSHSPDHNSTVHKTQEEVLYLENSQTNIHSSVKEKHPKENDSDQGEETCGYSMCPNATVIMDSCDKDKPRFYRPPTPGPRKVRQKKSLVKSITTESDGKVRENVRQFSYSEEIEDGVSKSEYCMIEQSISQNPPAADNHEANGNEDDPQLPLHNSQDGEMLIHFSHRKSSLLRKITKSNVFIPQHHVTCPGSLESSCPPSDASGLMTSASKHQGGCTPSAGNTCLSQKHNEAVEIKKYHNTSVRSSELSTCNNEEKCVSTNCVPSSECADTLVNMEHKMTKAEIMPSYKITSEAQDPYATPYSLSTGSQKVVSDCVEPRMGHEMSTNDPPLSAERCKKKKKHVQPVEQKRNPALVKEGTHFTEEGNCVREEMPQQLAPFAGNNIHKSSIQGQTTCAYDTPLQSTYTYHLGDLDKVTARPIISKKDKPRKERVPQVLDVESQEIDHTKSRPKGTKLMAKVRPRSVKRACLPPIAKTENALERIMSQEKEIECMLNPLGSDMNISHSNHDSHTTAVLMNDMKGLNSPPPPQNPLLEVVNDTRDEKPTANHADTNEGSQKSYKKQKKRKKNRKRDGLYDSKKKTAVKEKEPVLLQAYDSLPEMCHHSLESYVQNWLQNIFPNSSLPSHKLNILSANYGTESKINIEGDPLNTCATNNMQDTLQSKVCLTERCPKMEIDPVEEPSRALMELATSLEDSITEYSERKVGYLSSIIDTTGEEVKDLSCSSIRHDAKGGQQMLTDVKEIDGQRTELKVDIQGINIAIGMNTVDVAVQADVEFVTNKDIATSVSHHFNPDWFLACPQSSTPIVPIPASQCQCLQRPLIPQHPCSPETSSSPHLLLAWLIVLNLKDSLINILQNNNPHSTCSSTGILTLLQSLKQIAVTENADDLKEAVLNLQESTLSYELGKQNLALPLVSPSTEEVECVPNINESDICQENYMETNSFFIKEPVSSLEIANDSHATIVKQNRIEGVEGYVDTKEMHISKDSVIQLEEYNTQKLAQDIFVARTNYDSQNMTAYSLHNKKENDTQKITNDSFSNEGKNLTQMTSENILRIKEKQGTQKATDDTTGNEEPHNTQKVTYDGFDNEDTNDNQEVAYAGFGNSEVHGSQEETYASYCSEDEDDAQGEPEDNFGQEEENGANKLTKARYSQKEVHHEQGLTNNCFDNELKHVTREIIQNTINSEEECNIQKVTNDVGTFKPHSESECNNTEEKANNHTETDVQYEISRDSKPDSEYGNSQSNTNRASVDDEELLPLYKKTYTEEGHSTLVLQDMNDDISVHGEVVENVRKVEHTELTTKEKELEEKNGLISISGNTGGHQMEILENKNEGGGIIPVTSTRLSSPPTAVPTTDSEHIIQRPTQTMPGKSKVKMIVQEMEHRRFSDAPFQFRKCLQSPISSDGSDYRQDSDDSLASNSSHGASSEINTESGDETLKEKPYKTGFVKRTIERLYGKAEATIKPSHSVKLPSTPKTDDNNSRAASCTPDKEVSSSCQVLQSQSKTNVFRPSSSSERCQRKQKQHAKAKTIPNSAFPLLQPINSGEVYNYNENASSNKCDSGNTCTNQESKTLVQCEEDDGVLIDKGRWLLKENHLLRKSPPGTPGMYGNVETTSADTVLDNTSDDVPYSHFKNLNQHLPIADVSSSEVEDLAKPRNFRCNYFSMPHGSDSEPLHDDQYITSKEKQASNMLAPPTKTKEDLAGKSTCPPQMKREASGNTSPFTGVDFRLPDNKVHPQGPSTSADGYENPSENVNQTNREQIKEQDSLDKLHIICGQHCPILTALIEPINEEKRGFAYCKASDIENLLLLNSLSWESSNMLGLDKYTSRDENNNALINMEKITNPKPIEDIFYKFVTNSMMNLNRDVCDRKISILLGEHIWKRFINMSCRTHTESPLETQCPPMMEINANMGGPQCPIKCMFKSMQMPAEMDTNNNVAYQQTKEFDRLIAYTGHTTSSSGTPSQGLLPHEHTQSNQSTLNDIDQNFSENIDNCSTSTKDQEANISDTESNNEQ